MIRQRAVWAALALSALAPTLLADVIYVDAGQTGDSADMDGTSWARALPSLQTALALAEVGDEVWVATGVYRPGGAGRASTFALRNGVSLYGGFAGDETQRDQRDPATNVTVLNGDLNNDDAGGFYADNAYHVVAATNLSNATLDGFEIRSGRANGSGSARDGGGLFVLNANVQVRDCAFRRNACLSDGAGVWIADGATGSTFAECVFEENSAGSAGGGMLVEVGAPSLTGLTFADNTASDGGAIALSDGATVSDCAFSRNVATDTGGGVWIGGAAAPVITNCVFADNRASRYGGGAYSTHTSAPRFRDCLFQANTSDLQGGGAVATNDSTPVFHRCVFELNAAARHGGGLGLFRDSNGRVVNSVFRENAATTNGGGLYTYDSARLTVVNSAVYRNAAARGGGVSASGFSTLLAINLSACENTADQGSDGLLASDGGQLDVRNSIVWAHATTSISMQNQATVSVRYSCVQGGWDGPGNIADDPLFADSGSPDLRLSAGSPCVDAGLTDDAPLDISDVDDDNNRLEWVPQDLGGKGRFFDEPSIDEGACLGPPIDMGAYEFGGTGPQPCPADITGDGFVGLEDIREMLISFGENADGDVNCDGRTDLGDLALMLSRFGRACE
ncbi:MAG: right-handed parallel beta-helix repeat-containing protein [Phycisphaerales bacterium]|nr:right-handed parallel beta-helix repeat-containing protein [Phycisphaerales bacterium]